MEKLSDPTDNDPIAERRLAPAGISRIDVEVRIIDDDDHEVATGTIGEIVARGDHQGRPQDVEAISLISHLPGKS